MSTAIVVGSLSDIARQSGKSIAESFIGADCVVIVDTSASMSDRDSRGGKSRYDVACDELTMLQRNLPGKIAVISFSNTAQFCPGGQPVYLSGSTGMANALKFARLADVTGMRFVLISDGEPDSEDDALAEARKFKARIDTIFVGPERRPAGRDFLQRLAAASGGQSVTADRVMNLAEKTQWLLKSA